MFSPVSSSDVSSFQVVRRVRESHLRLRLRQLGPKSGRRTSPRRTPGSCPHGAPVRTKPHVEALLQRSFFAITVPCLPTAMMHTVYHRSRLLSSLVSFLRLGCGETGPSASAWCKGASLSSTQGILHVRTFCQNTGLNRLAPADTQLEF